MRRPEAADPAPPAAAGSLTESPAVDAQHSDALAVADAVVGGSRLLALRTASYVMAFLAGLVVARVLGAELRAQYALPLVLASCTWALMSLSLDTTTGRLLGRREASLVEVSRLLSAATLLLGSVGALAMFALGVLASDALLAGASATTIGLAALTVPLTLAVLFSTGLLVRLGALRAYGWTMAAGGAMLLMAVTVLAAVSALTPASAVAAVALVGAASAVALVVSLVKYTGLGGLVPWAPRRVWSLAVRAAVVLHPAYLAMFLNLRIDLFFVSAMTTRREAGLYSLSVTLAEIMFLASWTIVQSAAKTQTEAEPEAAARYTLEFVRQSWLLVVVAATLVSCAAYPMILLAYGSEWGPSVLPFVILAFAAVAFSLEMPVRILLARVARPRVILWPAMVGTAVNVALNLALIPPLGISGAAVASLCSYWLYALLLLARFQRVTGLPVWSAFGRPRKGDPIMTVPRSVGARIRGRGKRGSGS